MKVRVRPFALLFLVKQIRKMQSQLVEALERQEKAH